MSARSHLKPVHNNQTGSSETNRNLHALARRLLEILVYERCCRLGDSVQTDEVVETEIGDWKMPEFKGCCHYAASQGWLTIEGDCLTLAVAGIAAA